MEAALHDEKIREKLGIPKKVAQEYVNADKRKQAKKANDQAISLELYGMLERRRLDPAH